MKGFATVLKADLLRWWRSGMPWVFLLLLGAYGGCLGVLTQLHLGENRARFLFELGQVGLSFTGGFVLLLCLFPRLQEGIEGEGAYWLSQPLGRVRWALAHSCSSLVLSLSLVAALLLCLLGMLGVNELGAASSWNMYGSLFVHQLVTLMLLASVVILVTGVFHSSVLAASSALVLILAGMMAAEWSLLAWALPDLSRLQIPFGGITHIQWELLLPSVAQAVILGALGLWLAGKKD